MAIVNLGTFDYGQNPLFTLTFQQNGVPTNPGSVVVKLTDPTGTQSTPTTTNTATGTDTFQIPGGLVIAERWTGRAYAPPGSGQASVEFEFWVNPTTNA